MPFAANGPAHAHATGAGAGAGEGEGARRWAAHRGRVDLKQKDNTDTMGGWMDGWMDDGRMGRWLLVLAAPVARRVRPGNSPHRVFSAEPDAANPNRR